MPKMKTNRGAAKRFSKTGSGKYKRNQTGRRHILTKKNPKRMRRLRKPALIIGGQAKQVQKLVPYL